jgi:7-cyano-7-deazaguanine synthase
MRNGAVCLLSGGLDSATALWMAAERFGRQNVYPLTVLYGQRHHVELDSSRSLTNILGGGNPHTVISLSHVVGLNLFTSALTTMDLEVPKDRAPEDMSHDIPTTYVPGRNTIFFAMAASLAESLGVRYVYCGVNAVDYSGYPDCRPEFVRAFNELLSFASKSAVQAGEPIEVVAPLIRLTKAEIIEQALKLEVPIRHTHSCYSPVAGRGLITHPETGFVERTLSYVACGRCDSCQIRRNAFAQLGRVDPYPYAAE